MLRSATVVVALAACTCLLTPLHATQITYYVDVGGVEHGDGVQTIRVNGTVLFDTETQALVSTKLDFRPRGDALGFLNSPTKIQPSFIFGQGTDWHWLATPTELRLVTDYAGGILCWTDMYAGVFGGPKYGYYQHAQNGFLFNYGISAEPNADSNFNNVYIRGFLSRESGLLFGTAVPEPSTLALAALGAVVLLIAARRKR